MLASFQCFAQPRLTGEPLKIAMLASGAAERVEGAVVAVFPDSIRKSGSLRKFDAAIFYDRPQQIVPLRRDRPPYRSVSVEFEVDCYNDRGRTLAADYYDGETLDGNKILSVNPGKGAMGQLSATVGLGWERLGRNWSPSVESALARRVCG